MPTKPKYRSGWLMSAQTITSSSSSSKPPRTYKNWTKVKKKTQNNYKTSNVHKLEEKKDVVIDVETISSKRRTKVKPSPNAQFVAHKQDEHKPKEQQNAMKYSDEQLRVFQAIRAGKNVFLTGGAGTGKSHVGQAVIQQMKEREQKKEKNNGDTDADADDDKQTVYSIAPTGTAARNIHGTTIHSFLGLPLFFFQRNNIRGAKTYLSDPVKRRKTRERLKRTRLLFIDEISMVTPRDFCWLDELLRFIRQSRLPFGGVQLLVCGDFHQLPPVIDAALQRVDSRQYAFQTLPWSRARFEPIILTQVFRQKDDLEFYTMLNHIRVGNVTSEVDTFFRNLCAPAPPGIPLHAISNAFDGGKTRGVYLAAYRHVVATCNSVAIANLNPSVRPTRFSPTFMQHANEDLENKKKELETEKLPTMKEKEKEQTKEATVELKIGALVVLTVNWDTKKGIVNGRRGMVTKLDPLPSVVWDDDPEKTEWSIPLYRWFFECSDGVLEMEALPLTLCFAMTYHRSQGMTIKNGTVIDLSYNASSSSSSSKNNSGFGPGLAYVVLSRATRANHIRLINWSPEVVKINPLVRDFYAQITSNR